MSSAVQTPRPKSRRQNQGQSETEQSGSQLQERQLQPFFDESVTGLSIQPSSETRRQSKQRPGRKKQFNPSPNRPSPRKPGNGHGAEQGYHSESGTAHYLNNTRSQSTSALATEMNTYPLGGVDGASASRPSLTPADQTPVKQVYAGPNFLASPAASSLPMPKAFAKNLASSSSPTQKDLQAKQDQQPEVTPAKTPARLASTHGREGSPLDFLFHADKAERLRQSSSSLSPLSASPQHLQGQGRENAMRSSAPPPTSTSKERFLQEMDGVEEEESDTLESEEGPEVASYDERMAAARKQRDASAPAQLSHSSASGYEDAQTRVLKDLLFKPPQQQRSTVTETDSSPTLNRNRKAASVDIRGDPRYTYPSLASPTSLDNGTMPSQQPRQQPRQVPAHLSSNKTVKGSGSATAAPASDIKSMEDSLRKVLNIGT